MKLLILCSYLSSLEERINSLEHSLQSARSGARSHDSGNTLRQEGKRSSGRNSASLDIDVSEDEDGVDAMGAVVFANEEESGFFGIVSLAL